MSRSWPEPGYSRLELFFVFVSVANAALAAFASLFLFASNNLTLVRLTNLILVATYVGAGLIVFFNSRSDRRAIYWGLFLLLSSGSYGWELTDRGGRVWPDLFYWFEWFHGLGFQFFGLYYLWLFVERFPIALAVGVQRWIFRGFRSLAALSIGFFFLVGIVEVVNFYAELSAPKLDSMLDRIGELTWLVLTAQMLIAFSLLVWRFNRSVQEPRPEERRFVWILLLGMAAVFSILPLNVFFPAYRQLVPWYIPLVALIEVFVIAYSAFLIMANKILDVRTIARKVLQYLLARGTLSLIGAVPVVVLGLHLWRYRELPLTEILAGRQAPALVSMAILGLAFLRFRQPILDAVDRRFFRDRYHARRLLQQLGESVRGTRNTVELAAMVRHGVDLALHLEQVTVLVSDPAVGHLGDPLQQMRALDPGERLVTLLQSGHEPLAVDLDAPSSPFHALSEAELHWLIDARIEMLVPTYALDGQMNGLLALGGKKSQLPFLREDRDLLQAVASKIGLVIELLHLRDRTPPPPSEPLPEVRDAFDLPPVLEQGPDARARECPACGLVFPPDEQLCEGCNVGLENTLVPYVLRGQLRFERRIGTGGMAVVYRATDLRLGRTVAIKTLPRVSPEAAMRLHREARAAASVVHPGLAAIYGLETWEGVPMLVLEFLTGGTLADRLMRQPLEIRDMLTVGTRVAYALDRIHSAGILHRDVKPSNIGYTGDGEAKLLDFGIARIQHDLTRDGDSGGPSEVRRTTVPQTETNWIVDRTATGRVLGTASYLSPEALRNQRPAPSFDLWALSVVLYESLVAENLFLARSLPQMLEAIRSARAPDLREKLPDCPPQIAELFHRELHRDPARRSRTGRELAAHLEALAAEVL